MVSILFMTTKLQLIDLIQLYAELQVMNRFNKFDSSGFCKAHLKCVANIFELSLSEFSAL